MLTDAKVRTAKPRPKPYKLFDTNRLFLFVAPGGQALALELHFRWKAQDDGVRCATTSDVREIAESCEFAGQVAFGGTRRSTARFAKNLHCV